MYYRSQVCFKGQFFKTSKILLNIHKLFLKEKFTDKYRIQFSSIRYYMIYIFPFIIQTYYQKKNGRIFGVHIFSSDLFRETKTLLGNDIKVAWDRVVASLLSSFPSFSQHTWNVFPYFMTNPRKKGENGLSGL